MKDYTNVDSAASPNTISISTRYFYAMKRAIDNDEMFLCISGYLAGYWDGSGMAYCSGLFSRPGRKSSPGRVRE